MEAPHQQHQGEPEKLTLRDEELTWAHTIKTAVHEAEHLKAVSDFEIAQWALVTMERQEMDEVLERIYKLQYFREMYGFENVTADSSAETLTKVWKEGVKLMREYVKQMEPGHLLTIDFMPSQGHYLIVWDRAAFDPSRVQSEYDWKVYQGCTYCLLQILTSNLQAIREGVAVILECHGMGLSNYNSQFEERRVSELFNYFPFKNKEFCFLNTPTVAIMLYKVVKPFFSLEFHNAVQLDGKIDGFEGRIDTLYNVPNFEYAQDRLLERLQTYLKERLENQRTFTFPLPPEVVMDNISHIEEEQMVTDNNNVGDDFAGLMEEFAEDLEDFSENDLGDITEDLMGL